MADHFLIDAYAQIFIDRIAQGWTAYLLTFMCHQLSGGQEAIRQQQVRLIEEAYGRFLTRVVRRPTAPSQLRRLPIWICCPDYPVHKLNKDLSNPALLNDGQHAHGLAALPPWSRHIFNVADHFKHRQRYYVRAGGLSRVHASLITHDVPWVADYATKMISRRRIDQDTLLILPRSLSEVRDTSGPLGRISSNYTSSSVKGG